MQVLFPTGSSTMLTCRIRWLQIIVVIAVITVCLLTLSEGKGGRSGGGGRYGGSRSSGSSRSSRSSYRASRYRYGGGGTGYRGGGGGGGSGLSIMQIIFIIVGAFVGVFLLFIACHVCNKKTETQSQYVMAPVASTTTDVASTDSNSMLIHPVSSDPPYPTTSDQHFPSSSNDSYPASSADTYSKPSYPSSSATPYPTSSNDKFVDPPAYDEVCNLPGGFVKPSNEEINSSNQNNPLPYSATAPSQNDILPYPIHP